MNCAEVEKGNYTERYLLGDLDEAEVQELEEHYFNCIDCSEALKDASALCHELADDRWAVGTRPAPTRLRWRWAWAVATTMVLVGVGVVLFSRSQERSDAARLEITSLVAIEAPPYAPRRLRSSSGVAEGLFREAMVAYQEGDYAGAIPGLEAAVESDPQSAKSVFFLAACYLLTDQPAPAIETFGRVVELGKTPYLGAARLYRAKAYVLAGNLEAARGELEEVVRVGGEQQADAQRVLDQLPR